MTDEESLAMLAELHAHLEATQELPVERTAGRWIGEAEAITADLVGSEPSTAVLQERLGHVRELLANVETTDHARADEHVRAAEDVAAELLDRNREGTDH